MNGYLDYLFLGTILICAGGNIAHFGSRRILQVPSGRLLWGAAVMILLITPIVLLIRVPTWEVPVGSIIGAIFGAMLGRFFRYVRHDLLTSLVLVVAGSTLLISSLFLDMPL